MFPFSPMLIFLKTNDVTYMPSLSVLLMLIISVVESGFPFFCQVTFIPGWPVNTQVRLKVVPRFTILFSIPFFIVGTDPAKIS